MTAPEPITVYLSLGSNKGKREHFLRDALEVLSAHPAIQVTQVSRVYETEPWGKMDQPWFLNQVIELQTSLMPERLLMLCQSVEKKIGRLPSEPWGPREIDVDILLYGDQALSVPGLRVPHPHMNERRFVLVPLIEITPSLRDPVTGKSYKTILQELKDDHKVRPL
ncbi:MAG: 2-amino-4-hydroxy-6-hydroxymethyldihydropteridine diphosphokinase [Candidatus Peregrinibacteria bacterium]